MDMTPVTTYEKDRIIKVQKKEIDTLHSESDKLRRQRDQLLARLQRLETLSSDGKLVSDLKKSRSLSSNSPQNCIHGPKASLSDYCLAERVKACNQRASSSSSSSRHVIAAVSREVARIPSASSHSVVQPHTLAARLVSMPTVRQTRQAAGTRQHVLTASAPAVSQNSRRGEVSARRQQAAEIIQHQYRQYTLSKNFERLKSCHIGTVRDGASCIGHEQLSPARGSGHPPNATEVAGRQRSSPALRSLSTSSSSSAAVHHCPMVVDVESAKHRDALLHVPVGGTRPFPCDCSAIAARLGDNTRACGTCLEVDLASARFERQLEDAEGSVQAASFDSLTQVGTRSDVPPSPYDNVRCPVMLDFDSARFSPASSGSSVQTSWAITAQQAHPENALRSCFNATHLGILQHAKPCALLQERGLDSVFPMPGSGAAPPECSVQESTTCHSFATPSAAGCSFLPLCEPPTGRLHNASSGGKSSTQPAAQGPRPSRLAEKERKRQYRIGLNLFNKKPDNGINYLVDRRFLERTPRCLAQFLLSRRGLSKQLVGEYLGDLQQPFNQDVLRTFANELDWTGLELDAALRKFLALFRLPGEAQKIQRIVEVFSQRYCTCNPAFAQQFKSPDAVFLISFAIILLNTDLHNPNIKGPRRMSVQGFIANLKGVDSGKDIDSKLLASIYERIQQHELQPGVDHTTQVHKVEETIVEKKCALPQLTVPFRRLVCYCRLYEVRDPSKREKAGAHQREIFLFNDILVITKIFTKKKNSVTYSFRESLPLIDLHVSTHETEYCPYGINLMSTADHRTLVYFNARNQHDREKFVEDITESILEMNEMERLRLDEAPRQHRPSNGSPAVVVATITPTATLAAVDRGSKDSGVVDLAATVSPAASSSAQLESEEHFMGASDPGPSHAACSGAAVSGCLRDSTSDLENGACGYDADKRHSNGSIDSGMISTSTGSVAESREDELLPRAACNDRRPSAVWSPPTMRRMRKLSPDKPPERSSHPVLD